MQKVIHFVFVSGTVFVGPSPCVPPYRSFSNWFVFFIYFFSLLLTSSTKAGFVSALVELRRQRIKTVFLWGFGLGQEHF